MKEQRAAETKGWEEKYNDLDTKFNRLQKRAKQRIQELTKVSGTKAIYFDLAT